MNIDKITHKQGPTRYLFRIDAETDDEDEFLQKLAETTTFIDDHGRLAPGNHIRLALIYDIRWREQLKREEGS